MACMRLAKGLIVAGRKFGEKLQEIYDGLTPTDDVTADEEKWLALVQKQFGIPPEVALIFADFSALPEAKNAPALPAQAMPLLDALELLTYLTPTGIAAEPEEVVE